MTLFACEAQYHPSWRREYIRDSNVGRTADEQAKSKQTELEEVHRRAFSTVTRLVDHDILEQKQIVKLNDLLQVYISDLANTEFPNPNYKAQALKVKLEKSYNEKLSFSLMENKGTFPTYLVFSTDIGVQLAMRCAYELGTKDVLLEVANLLRQIILEACEKIDPLEWPPSACSLDNLDVLPPEVHKFLTIVISGSASCDSQRVTRLVNSIGQDICRAATNGQWKLPKHILICMTMRHLFRSAELTTLLNRLGHSESYSFSLELETAIASALQETSRLLSTQVVRNPGVPALFHSDFDNFDQLLNDLTGKGSVHTAHGIMMQELMCNDDNHGGVIPEVSSIAKSGDRSLNLQPVEKLPDCFVSKRRSPSYAISTWTYPGSEDALMKANQLNFIWLLIRTLSFQDEQQVPSWGGFVSLTGVEPTKLTTIDYYPVINHPITDYATVQECLRYSEEATKEVGQEYTLTSFDLGVCMKAYPLIWNNPEKYQKHIIMIGTFHLVCAYFKMIGKKMDGSGVSDILLEADRRIDMKELMAFPLTPIPYSIGTADGFLAKTDKAKGYHHLTKDIEDAVVLQGEKTLVIEDGNASFYYMKELPDNFNQISHKVFDIMSKNPDVIFSTDMYKDDSVKAMERKRRGCAEKLIIKGENTKKPADWKKFLTNDQNKKQFIEILLTVWSSDRFADKLKGRSVTLICEGRAYCLSSEDGRTTLKTEIRSLASTQEETDSRVILYCIYGKENGYKIVRVKSPDSDIFSILLHYAYAAEITIHFETGAGNKRRLIDMTELAHRYTQQHCTALMALHAFTGCDSTSAFKGIGKIKPIKTLQKMPKFEPVLAQLGDSWEVSDDLFTGLEEFTCAVYGKPRFSEVDDLRYSIGRKEGWILQITLTLGLSLHAERV